MADLAALRELYAWMREERILYARCGELELRLEPVAPAPLAPSGDASPSDDGPEDAERRSLEVLLYSSGAEADQILNVMRRQRAA